MQQLAKGMRCAIKNHMYSATGDVTGLRYGMIFVTIHTTALVTTVTAVAPTVRKQNKEMTVSIQICDHNTAY